MIPSHEWLSELYKERSRWVPIFLKKDFWAGMSTTQRGENIHPFFDGYINSTTSLQQFVQLYDNALCGKVEKEFEADLQSFNTTIRCGSNSMIEKKLQSAYTHAKFNEVQVEFRAKINCSVSLKHVEGSICTYDVLEDIIVGGQPKEANFEVVFHRDNHDFSCKCLLFEFRGIMCRHSLIVFAQERVKQVPLKYILPRWSKNKKRRHSYTKSSYDVTQLKPQMQRYDNLCKDFYEIAEVAAEFEDVTHFLQNSLHDLKRKVHIMAGPGDLKKSEWIDRIRSEGSVPLLDPVNCSNGWASPPGAAFIVRGPEYFRTKVKIPAVRRVIDDEFPADDKPFVWAFNLQLPSKDNYSAVAYFTNKEPITEGSLMDQFLKGDDAFRNSRLKLIANIVNGPWIVRKAVGEQAICIIGRALSCKFCVAENFIEVDIDIGSSMVATAIVHLAFGYVTTMTVDLAFLIESQAESELPEKLLGAFRFSNLNPASATQIELSSVLSTGGLQRSLSKRLWNSIGHILLAGSKDGSQNTKTVDHKNWI
ncbi:Protein ENHANCED DISEASE RESISTANCE 2-like protein, partial [Mucuna pruriens]